jgi:putative glycosyltransferase (TIGR04372 family)
MLPVRGWLWPIVQVTEQRIDEARRLRPRWLVPAHGVHQGFFSRDLTGLLERAGSPTGIFRPEEIEAGFGWLRSLGWSDGDKVVCLLVRDSEYLDSFGGGPGSQSARRRRNSYRDSDIATYVPAAEWLADQGVWVLRMGKVMKDPMESQHPRVIDYAFRDDRSDFLDVWLFANCDLCISTVTGADMISDVYRRPLLALNVLPAMHLWSWSNTVAAPKPLAWKDSGRRLSIEELVGANFYFSQEYAEQGIEIRELDADVLKDIVQEAWLRVDGSWSDEPDDVYRTAAAWAVLEAHPDYSRHHGYRHPAARFSSVWLRHVAEQQSPSAGGS